MIIPIDEAREIDPTIDQEALDSYESSIRHLTNNNFQLAAAAARFYRLSIGDDDITVGIGDLAIIRDGDTLEVSDDGLNDGSLIVVEGVDAEARTVAYSGASLISGEFRDSFVTIVRYPADVKEGVKRLIKYDMDMGSKLGIKSETVSRMSVSYYDVNSTESISGYPATLMDFVKKYEKMRWG
jgi:hypothetical protein